MIKYILFRIFLLKFLFLTIESNKIVSKRSQIDPLNYNQSPITYIRQTKSFPAIIDSSPNHHQFSSKSHNEIVSNKELLKVLGLRSSSSIKNHRKQLESKTVESGDDSRMFIIKLPPNYNYYINENDDKTASVDGNQNNMKVALGFKSNGKPGAIYHWNLPIIENLLQMSMGRSRLTYKGMSAAIDASSLLPEGRISLTNDDYNRKVGKKEVQNGYRKSMHVYYAPKYTRPASSKSIFTNGKPQSFYVMKSSNETQNFTII